MSSFLATFLWPSALAVPVPLFARFALAGMFAGAGLACITRARTELARAKAKNKPAMFGVYSLCRHPMYAGWLLGLFPAITIISGSWPMIGLPIAAWIGYKMGLPDEEQALMDQFGDTYRNYRRQTRELLPLPPKKERKR